MRVAGALARLGPDARALAHVPGGLLHRPLLEHQLLAHPVLEVEVGVVHAAAKRSAQQPLHRGRGQPEPIFEKALRARQHVVLLERCAKDFHPSIGSGAASSVIVTPRDDAQSVPVNGNFRLTLGICSRVGSRRRVATEPRPTPPARTARSRGSGAGPPARTARDTGYQRRPSRGRGPALTALTPCQPGRAAMAARSTGFPHQDARMMSGSRLATSSAVTCARARPARRAARGRCPARRRSR